MDTFVYLRCRGKEVSMFPPETEAAEPEWFISKSGLEGETGFSIHFLQRFFNSQKFRQNTLTSGNFLGFPQLRKIP